MAKSLILIVDDDPNICEALRIYLEPEGWDIATIHDGNSALKAIRKLNPSLVLLDVALPGQSGWQILGEIRSQSKLPVIMLTARGETYDKVHGLNLGADDYIVKPFDPQELLARVRAILRRVQPALQIELEDLRIDLERYQVSLAGEEVNLTPKELELLHVLAATPNRVFTRQQLLDQIWGYDYAGDTRTVDVHIKRLRSKLNCPRKHWDLQTVWSVGYKFVTRERSST
ncbi:MAG: response regulator transcription factor [Firmicutes bacterium]|nr:response regulator transcription factor [Bacillota bacterium]